MSCWFGRGQSGAPNGAGLQSHLHQDLAAAFRARQRSHTCHICHRARMHSGCARRRQRRDGRHRCVIDCMPSLCVPPVLVRTTSQLRPVTAALPWTAWTAALL
jgi:hypothetical protein